MNVKKSHFRIQKLSVIAACTAMSTFAWGQAIQPEAQTNMTNRGSIANTRHNMTFSGSLYQHTMDNGRNDYQEVCVYCHTPHGASTVLDVPLWNRTTRATTYQTYNQLATGSFSVDPAASMQPGAQSLSCLSCHDGQTAIDSIINMPSATRNDQYKGRYLASQQTTQNLAFLDSWNNQDSGAASVPGAADTLNHTGMNSRDRTFPGTPGYVLGNGTGGDGVGCLSCHSDVGTPGPMVNEHDMRAALIGTDLRNDHPIGVKFPAANGTGTDWKQPSGTNPSGSISFFESTTGSAGLDKTDIRLYQTGLEARVECASCHDPHGVPSAGVGSDFLPMFLRVDNKGSGVCFSCHTK